MVAELDNPEESTEPIDLDSMTLGEIFLAQMLGEIPESNLNHNISQPKQEEIHYDDISNKLNETPIQIYDLEDAKFLTEDRIDDGEMELRQFAKILASKFLPKGKTRTYVCNNYYEYLTTLKTISGLDLETVLTEQDLTPHQRTYLSKYLRLDDKDPVDNEFKGFKNGKYLGFDDKNSVDS
ncbi:MAG: hypothetical protein KKH52_04265, partial [Nanoarchaeota archaeon]|nr:hypothetical protein [Nanoarchaeota archaeon]